MEDHNYVPASPAYRNIFPDRDSLILFIMPGRNTTNIYQYLKTLMVKENEARGDIVSLITMF
jgi:hypothetical protein